MWRNKTFRNIDLTLSAVILGFLVYEMTKDYLEMRRFDKAYAVNHPETPR